MGLLCERPSVRMGDEIGRTHGSGATEAWARAALWLDSAHEQVPGKHRAAASAVPLAQFSFYFYTFFHYFPQ